MDYNCRVFGSVLLPELVRLTNRKTVRLMKVVKWNKYFHEIFIVWTNHYECFGQFIQMRIILLLLLMYLFVLLIARILTVFICEYPSRTTNCNQFCDSPIQSYILYTFCCSLSRCSLHTSQLLNSRIWTFLSNKNFLKFCVEHEIYFCYLEFELTNRFLQNF